MKHSLSRFHFDWHMIF